ncbi:MAG: adenine deaminase [Anaerolineae bacterium]
MNASLVVRNCRFVNVVTREVLDWELACCGTSIIYAGPDAVSLIDEDTTILDAQGQYLLPGLISAHDHNEMTMMSMVPFTEAVLPQGTTSVILDPHDSVNVLGIAGLEAMLAEARDLPLHTVFMASPCVPSAPGLEHAGAEIGVRELAEMVALPGVRGVAEAMDFLGIINPTPEREAMLAWIRDNHLLVDGHCPELRGMDLNRYIAAGPVRTDHESASVDEQLEKLRTGMYVILRRGSVHEPMLASDLVNQLADTSNLLLAVDGCISVEDILQHGHMAWAVRQIIAEGVDPLVAIQMATLNVARCYGLDSQVGLLAPGRLANFILVDNLANFRVQAVYANGGRVPERLSLPRYTFKPQVTDTLRLNYLTAADFSIPAPTGAEQVTVRAVGVGNGALLTDEVIAKLETSQGLIQAEPGSDILKLAVFNRYGLGTRCLGFVHGYGLKRGAVAGSIGQDSQHLVVIGANDQDMQCAANRVNDLHGGFVVASDNQVIAELALPIAGIMTDASPLDLAARRLQIIRCCRELGSQLDDPIFILSLAITLVVIPQLKMSDLGLVDVATGQFKPLIVA